MSARKLFVGVDLGTTGCRACAIDENGELIGGESIEFSAGEADDPECWWQAVNKVVRALAAGVDACHVTALAVDGTSGSVLITDARGQPLAPPLMYADARATEEAALITCVRAS